MGEAHQRPRQPWTEKDQRQAEQMRAQGLSYAAIGRHLGRGTETVRLRLDPIAAEKDRERKRMLYKSDPSKALARCKQYKLKNREKVLAGYRRHYRANLERARLYAREKRRADPEKALARDRRYRAENLEKTRDAVRRYREANREALRARDRKRYKDKDPDIRRSKYLEWQRSNRDKVRARNRCRYAMRRAARRRALLPVTFDCIRKQFALFGDQCAYCGADEQLTVDHVLALNAGGLDQSDNIAPACPRCNSSKNASPVESWYRQQPFFTEARWRKIQRHCPAAVAGQLPLSLAA